VGQNENLLTTSEVCEILGISKQRLNQLILDERLPATKIKGEWRIKREDLKLVEDRKPGRPRKGEEEEKEESETTKTESAKTRWRITISATIEIEETGVNRDEQKSNDTERDHHSERSDE
jgi:excisionase family DNA binding protein